MSEERPTRVVLVLRDGLAANHAANAAAVLGATIGTRRRLPCGPEATDASGTIFEGIITTPIPILVADPATLTTLFRLAGAYDDVEVSCLNEVARQARSYETYLETLATTVEADGDLVGLCLVGPRNRITKMTKRLSLMQA